MDDMLVVQTSDRDCSRNVRDDVSTPNSYFGIDVTDRRRNEVDFVVRNVFAKANELENKYTDYQMFNSGGQSSSK